MIIDEAHLAAADTLSKVFVKVNYIYLLCLTGTLERLDGKEKIITHYAPVCDRITIEEAEANGWVSPIAEYKVLLDVDLTEYNEWNTKFNGFFSYFGWDFNIAMKCATDITARNKYAKLIGDAPKVVAANAFGWMTALRKRKEFIAKHPKKLEICNKILESRKDKKCITFSATIEDSEKIKTGLVMHSKQSKKKNAQVIEKFNSMTSGVLNTSKAADQGVDVKGLSVGIIMSIDSSKIRKQQRVGRCVRFEPGKQAELFTLVLKGTQEEKWFDNSITRKYQTITEQQLDTILSGGSIEQRERENISTVNYRF